MAKWSQFGIKTYRENPADAEVPSHQLLMRAGLVKKLSAGLYTYGPLFNRSIKKMEAIIREELDSMGMAEVFMPMVQPKALWVESGRWGYPDMQTFTNKNDNEFCLGPTHEEVITDYVRNDITSYKELPVYYYQIQGKYRDEIRPRFGLMRGREFLMKDAYSFDESVEKAQESYYKIKEAYINIFNRVGAVYRIVKADGGSIGGTLTEEFQLLAEVGEDELLVSDTSDFAANIEICPRIEPGEAPEPVSKEEDKEEFATPELKTIDDLAAFLKVPTENLVKTMLFEGQNNEGSYKFTVLLRGSDQVNLIKIKNHLKLKNEPRLLTDEEVRALTGAGPGSCGPVNLETPIYMDNYLQGYKSMVVGANRDDYHLKGVSPDRDFKVAQTFDLTIAKAGEPSPDGKGNLQSIRGIEVGQIFYLGKKYSESMNAKFLDAQGKSKAFEMGCYGIGVTRTLQALIEQSKDENGIIWPKSVAPFDVHVCVLDLEQDIENYVSELEKNTALSFFIDDRKDRPGVKFKDADLIGLPIRVTLGKKTFDKGVAEIVIRKTGEKKEVKLEELSKTLEETYEAL